MSNWPKSSRQSRGYGASWDRLRLIVLRRDGGLCQCDQCQGGRLRITRATECHHIRSKADGGTDALENLQAINSQCHKRISLEQQGRTPKPKVGIDGYPSQS